MRKDSGLEAHGLLENEELYPDNGEGVGGGDGADKSTGLELPATQEVNADRFDSRSLGLGKADFSKLVRLAMTSPLNPGEMKYIDGKTPLSAITRFNTDGQTRILVYGINQAANGNIKWAELLFRYAGYEPPKEAHVQVETPVFIDDMSVRAEAPRLIDVTPVNAIEGPSDE